MSRVVFEGASPRSAHTILELEHVEPRRKREAAQAWRETSCEHDVVLEDEGARQPLEQDAVVHAAVRERQRELARGARRRALRPGQSERADPPHVKLHARSRHTGLRLQVGEVQSAAWHGRDVSAAQPSRVALCLQVAVPGRVNCGDGKDVLQCKLCSARA